MREPQEPRVAPPQLGETALRDLVDAAFDALVITRGGAVLFANRSFCEMSGWAPEEVVDRSVLEFVAPAWRGFVVDRMKEGGESRYEAQGLRRDGSLIDVEICARQCLYQGEAARITAIRYIEDRKRAEAALRKSEARLREVIERLPDMIAVHRAGVLVFANPALVRYFGHRDMQELVGRPVTDFVHPDDADAARERARLTYELRQPGPLLTMRTLRPDGSSGVVEVASAPIEFDGAPAVLAIARDVAERRLMEARLVQADLLASVGMLAAGITHEINNPLAYILLNLDLIATRLDRLLPTFEEAPADDPASGLGGQGAELAREIRRLLADTRDGASQVKRIVHDFRVFARGGDGRARLLDVRDVLDSAMKLALNELRHRARLVRNYEEVPLVEADDARLGQLFLNVLVNALHALPDDATPETAEIRVSTRTGEGMAIVEIVDTGVGIPRELLGRVFEPFFTTKPVGLGSGLGLSICENIVNALGGRIEVESEPGAGTTCRVHLPAATATEAAPEPCSTEPQPARSGRPRLLIVDDEQRLLTALADQLSGDYDVEATTSGADAIRRLLARSFDLVVCDLMMPGTSAAEVHHAARQARPGLERRFVFMTGGAFTSAAASFLESVPNARLDKPFELSELCRVLDDVLRESALER